MAESNTIQLERAEELSREHLRRFTQFQESRAPQDLKDAIQTGEEALEIVPKHLSSWSEVAFNHCSNLKDRAIRERSEDDLLSVIALLRQIIDDTANNHPRRPMHLHSISFAALNLFRLTRKHDDLEDSINFANQALTSAEGQDTQRAILLGHLSECLEERAKKSLSSSGNPIPDLDEAVRLRREALSLAQKDVSEYAIILHDLSQLLAFRYKCTRNLESLIEAIRVGQQSHGLLVDDHTRFRHLNDLSIIFEEKYTHSNNLIDLEESIKLVRQAVSLSCGIDSQDPQVKLHRAICQMNLSQSLGTKFDLSADPGEIEEALKLAGQALAAVARNHPLYARFLDCLSSQLRRRAEFRLHEDDLQKAKDFAEEAVNLGDQSIRHEGIMVRNLSQILCDESKRTGSLSALQRSISLLEEVLDPNSSDWITHAANLSGLADRYCELGKRTGVSKYINKAVDLQREIFNYSPENHGARLNTRRNLIDILHARYHILEAWSDLEEAINLSRGEIHHVSHQQRRIMTVLGDLIGHKFDRWGKFEDLDEAISILRKGKSTLSLCDKLRVSFRMRGNRHDLQEAIDKLREALKGEASPIYKVAYQLRLADALSESLEWDDSSSAVEWEKAVEGGRDMLSALPKDHPERSNLLQELAKLVQKPPRQCGESSAWEKLRREYYEEALKISTAPPLSRIHAGMHLFHMYRKVGELRKARDVSESIIYELLPRLSLRLLPRRDQQFVIGRMTKVASLSAGAVLQDGGSAYEAIKLLEAGRTMIANLTIVSHRDASELAKIDMQLHDEYVHLRNLVSAPFHEGLTEEESQDCVNLPTVKDGEHPFMKSIISSKIAERARFIERLEIVEKKLRTTPGFDWLFSLWEADSLKQLASEGSIVLFNTTHDRSDALLVTNQGIIHLPLNSIDFNDLETKMNRLVGNEKLAVGPLSTKARRQQELQEILKRLWEAAVKPVLTNLKLIKDRPVYPLPRIWWVTSGLLGLAPLHAAGTSNMCTSDFVISSYIPNIRSLQYARESAAQNTFPQEPDTLVVSMPRTDGNWRPLNTKREELALRNIMRSNPPKVLRMPSKSEVLIALPDCDIAHFACHGWANAQDPSAGGLLLGPGGESEVQLLSIAELSDLSYQRARIAYLSACSTAENASTTLLDEVIHIASSFQLIGFPHVIGTLWEARDSIAPEIAETFYENLMQEVKSNDSPKMKDCVVARALWGASEAWRKKKPKDPLAWAPYIHFGA